MGTSLAVAASSGFTLALGADFSASDVSAPTSSTSHRRHPRRRLAVSLERFAET